MTLVRLCLVALMAAVVLSLVGSGAHAQDDQAAAASGEADQGMLSDENLTRTEDNLRGVGQDVEGRLRGLLRNPREESRRRAEEATDQVADEAQETVTEEVVEEAIAEEVADEVVEVEVEVEEETGLDRAEHRLRGFGRDLGTAFRGLGRDDDDADEAEPTPDPE